MQPGVGSVMPSQRVRQQHPEFFTAPDEPDGYVPNVFIFVRRACARGDYGAHDGIGDAVIGVAARTT